MTMRFILGFALTVAAAMAFAVAAAPAGAQPAGPTTDLSAVKKHKAPRHPRPQAGQIACTVAGCQRIPANCHPEIGYNWDGIPTGFDIVVCPRGGR